MRNKHPSLSGHGLISKEYYVQQNPSRETDLVNRFGNLTTETIWFGQDVQTIKIYTDGGQDGIYGLSIQTSSETHYIGACDTVPMSITLDTPHETLTEIGVRTSDLYRLAVAVSSKLFQVVWLRHRG